MYYRAEHLKGILASYKSCVFSLEHLCSSALEYIQQLESAQPKWISVDERLPEDDLPEGSNVKGIKVFVAIKGKNRTTLRTQFRHKRTLYGGNDKPSFVWEWKYSAGNVTHWMPLPSTEGIE